ncbi:MAG: ferritin-like domain-containing protein [Bacteriovoracia bacterium]
MKLFLERAREIVLSVYLYNEGRGYIYLEELLRVFALKYPQEAQLIASIRKHADDERRHHSLFQSYFRDRNRKPFQVGSWYGYCDQIVARIFGKTLDQLEPSEVIHDDKKFFQLCRLIMITELRGMKQVNLILRSPLVRTEPELVKIFSVVQRDEPSHCYPYQAWLRRHGEHEPSLREKLADWNVHYSLMLLKLPVLFFNPWLRRREVF